MIMISDKYREQNRILHKRPRGFGASGHRWVKRWNIIPTIIMEFGIVSLFDYGCGQSKLWEALCLNYPELVIRIRYAEYDPCINGKDKLPNGELFDLVVCTDVLEHVEPEFLDKVISHVFSFAAKVVFFNVSLVEANKILPDGRNAHLIIKPMEWWIDKIAFFSPNWRLGSSVFKTDLIVRCTCEQ